MPKIIARRAMLDILKLLEDDAYKVDLSKDDARLLRESTGVLADIWTGKIALSAPRVEQDLTICKK